MKQIANHKFFPDTHFRRHSDEDPIIILRFLKDGESPKGPKDICVCIHVCVYMHTNINIIFKGNLISKISLFSSKSDIRIVGQIFRLLIVCPEACWILRRNSVAL